MDASKKWCPWARGLWCYEQDMEHMTFNRNEFGYPPESCTCIEDRCIAWRKYVPTKDGDPSDAVAFVFDCARIRGPEDMVIE